MWPRNSQRAFGCAADPWPLASGDPISLFVCDTNWALSDNQVRVEHSTIVFGSRGQKLVTYTVGGPGTTVWVTTSFPAGYPAYPGDDPLERIFSIDKAGGGPINTGDEVSGDEVSLRITGYQAALSTFVQQAHRTVLSSVVTEPNRSKKTRCSWSSSARSMSGSASDRLRLIARLAAQ